MLNILWLTIFIWPVILAILGAVLLPYIWDLRSAGIIGCLIGMGIGMVDAMLIVRFVIKRKAAKSDRACVQ